MRVYIAGASREVQRVRAAQGLAERWGWELTLDWLTHLMSNVELGVHDRSLSVAEQRTFAQADLDAIERADLVWVLSPRERTKGAWWEAGHANALGIPVVFSGCTEDTLPSIFAALCPFVAEDDDVQTWWMSRTPKRGSGTINSRDPDVAQVAAALADAAFAGGLSDAYYRKADDALGRIAQRDDR